MNLDEKKYSDFERNIANLLNRLPHFKSKIKKIYQYINQLLFQTKKNVISNWKIKKIYAKKDEETFFGYYDKSPICKKNEKILFHSCKNTTAKLPSGNNRINIVVMDINTSQVVYANTTNSYNWQQGARLQWLDDNKIIYNLYEDGIYISKIVNIKTNKEKNIPFPVYDCYKDFAVSLNFDRLNDLSPDYGYRNGDQRFKRYSDKKDGIFFINLKNLEFKLIISIEDLKILKSNKYREYKNSKHQVNHIMISPNGKKMMFLHRWFIDNIRYDRLIVSNIDGTEIKIALDQGMVSHCCWNGNDEIITFAKTKKYGEKYYKIKINAIDTNIVPINALSKMKDGHLSIKNNKILFDTYPNRKRMKNLFIYDMKENTLDNVGSFFESLKFYEETRCDLHPRWNFDGTTIAIDSVHDDNKRYLYLLRE